MALLRSLALGLALALVPASASAEEPYQARLALASMEGTWVGELYYLDYQTGQRFGIPMLVNAERTPDGATLLQRVRFTDPGTEVYAVTLTTVEADSGDILEAYFREQRGEFARYALTSIDYASPGDWTLVMTTAGTDDDRPANIRITLARQGDDLDSLKEVQFTDEADGRWFKRNGTELKRAAGASR